MVRGRISFFIVSGVVIALTACGSGDGSSNTHPTNNPAVPTVAIIPSPASATTLQEISVAVSVAGSNGTATGTVILKSQTYTSTATALNAGNATIQIPAGALAAGTDTLTASYTPDSASKSTYTTASGTGTVTVTKATPTLTVTGSAANIRPAQALAVTVAVSGGSGAPTATGAVKLTSGTYTSGEAALANGSATINVPAGALATGRDTLTATFAPDTAGAAIYSSASGTGVVTVATIVPTVTVTPSAANITTQQSLAVTVAVTGGTGDPEATGTVTLSSGNYTSVTAALASGSAAIDIPPATLPAGTDTLIASYTPDTTGAGVFSRASGANTVSVTKITPTVTVLPARMTTNTGQDLPVTVTVIVPSGNATPTGTVVASSGSYHSAATTLAGGTASLDLPAGALAAGSDTLTAVYTPDTAAERIYNPASGTSGAVTVVQMTVVSVNQGVSGPAVRDTLLGMNMAVWFDIHTNKAGIQSGLHAAGIKAVRWPGGSKSDKYHWATNSYCNGYPDPNSTYINFIYDLEIPIGLDVALTANYGTNSTCNGPGDPAEAASWVQYAEAHGGHVSHMTVGNEVYGNWETDLHANPNDPATYANAMLTGYYPDIKAVDPNVMVGVVVDADNKAGGWDSTVLSNAKNAYDFVEFHYYPQKAGHEDDSYLLQQAVQGLTTALNTIKVELAAAGNRDIPIYVGSIGSVYTDPGKQTWSITQGLYAGEVLGEMMNQGISHLTWWIGYGSCNGGDLNANNNDSLYGWQTWGAYNVFSDGPSDTACPNAGPIGTMSPTARAFQLFSNVAVNGESVLTPAVKGDTTNVRAYAATHGGGTALVLFNLNQTRSEPVEITLSAETSTPGVTVITYSKSIYDASKNGNWDPPSTTDMRAQPLPLALTLDPWSMNVVLIQ